MSVQKKYIWLWVLPCILLMSAIAVPRLGFDGFWYDELYSVRNSGGTLYGPLSPIGVIQRVAETDPYQSLGYPLFLAGWGALVGWTEFASRVSSWLIGVITIAVAYRAGRTTLSSNYGGILSALIMSLSAFFIHFNHELRGFTPITLSATLLIWSYVHLLKNREQSYRLASAGFIISGASLLWIHYYTALFLVGVGLYHLIFTPKNTRWLWITGLFIPIGMLFVPQIPSFLAGFMAYKPENLGQIPLTAIEVVQTVIYYGGNGQSIITVILLIAGILYAWRKQHNLRAIAGITLVTMMIVLLANDVLEMLEPRRIRYVIYLVPLIAIWLSGGVLVLINALNDRLNQSQKNIVLLTIPLLIMINGIYVNMNDDFTESLKAEPIPNLRSVVTALDGNIGSSDLLAFYNGTATDAYYMREILALALANTDIPTIFTANLYVLETSPHAWDQYFNSDRIWYAVNRNLPLNDYHSEFVNSLGNDFILCDTIVDRRDISLELWTRDEIFCPSDTVTIEYQEIFTLGAVGTSMQDNQLTIQMAWKMNRQTSTTLTDYSFAIFLVDTEDESIVYQQDTGFPVADYFPFTRAIDLNDIPAGNYDLRVVTYQWQTGARLDGVTGNGSQGDYLTISNLDIP